MSLINGGPTPVAVAPQETQPREAREPAQTKPLPKGEAAAQYQANKDAARRAPQREDSGERGKRVDIDA
jgi:hypothetical protein